MFFLTILMAGVPFVLSAFSLYFMYKKQKHLTFEICAFFAGVMYSAGFYAVAEYLPYDEPINIYGLSVARMHEPVSSEHIMTLLSFLGVGLISYFVLKYARQHLSPVLQALSMGGLLLGLIFDILLLLQLLSGAGAHEIPTVVPEIPTFRVDGTMCILILCIVPAHFLILSVQVVFQLLRENREAFNSVEYQNSILKGSQKFLHSSKGFCFLAVLCCIPLFLVVMAILVLCGQKPDSAVLAFTETSDWMLSAHIAPPAVAFDAHYLCTVSLRGHRKLVKPLRYGIRHEKEKIVVNRQLMVANAFEELLMERMPRFHHALRRFYDTYGYPVSRHIRSAVSADIVYCIMKPLEWLFLLILYTFDKKPENRIATQYLPADIRRQLSDQMQI